MPVNNAGRGPSGLPHLKLTPGDEHPAVSKVLGQSFLEPGMNASALVYVLQHPGMLPEKCRDWAIPSIKKILKNIVNNQLEVRYYQKAYVGTKIGRLFTESSGYQSLMNIIRNALLTRFGRAFDIDAVNCQPVILQQLCGMMGVECPALTQYIASRDEKITEVMEVSNVDRATAKQLFTRLVNLSLIESWVKEYDTSGKVPEFALDFEQEMKNIVSNVCASFPEVYALSKSTRLNDDYANPKARCIALVLGHLENEAMCSAVVEAQRLGYQISTLVFDGFIAVHDSATKIPDKHLASMNKAALEGCGFELQFIVKPFDESLEFPMNVWSDEAYVTDWTAAKRFVDAVGRDRIVNTPRGLFIFDEATGIFTKKTHVFKQAAAKHRDQIFVHGLARSLRETSLDPGGSMTDYKKMEHWLEAVAHHDDNFWVHAWKTTYEKLLFTNGWFDMRTGTFHKEFDPKMRFRVSTNRPYMGHTVTEADKQEVLYNLYKNPLTPNGQDPDFVGDEMPIWKFLLRAQSLAYAGDISVKKVYALIGFTNSGKGIQTLAHMTAGGGFVDGAFDANNLLYNRNSSQDEAKKLAFMRDLADLGVRLAFGNEMRIEIHIYMDGNLIKKIGGGGDNMKTRGNYEDEFIVRPQLTLFLCVNDLPDVKPRPEDRFAAIYYCSSYQNNPVRPIDKKADPYLKEKVQSDRYANALLELIFEEYREYLADGGRENFVVPKSVQAFTDENCNDSADLVTVLNKQFEFHQPKMSRSYYIENELYVSAKCVNTFIKDNKTELRSTTMKAKRDLEALGYLYDHTTINGVSDKYILGVTLRE